MPAAGCAAAVVAGRLTAWLGLALFALYLNPAVGQKERDFSPSTFTFSFTSVLPDLGAEPHHTQPTTVGNHEVLWRKVVVAIYPN